MKAKPTIQDRSFILCGVDPGVNTGLAVWDRRMREFSTISTLTIVQAMDVVRKLHESAVGGAEVWFEDARLRTWFGAADQRQQRYGAGIREGVGSVKRDAAIWQEFCEHHRIPWRSIKPAKGATKWDADRFRQITGYDGRTSSHGRDAGALVWGA